MHDLPNTVRTSTVSGKTYECPARGQPILTALRDDRRLPADVVRTFDNVLGGASG
jgi:hypothetical protein